AEGGKRVWQVTGVQTCALPISPRRRARVAGRDALAARFSDRVARLGDEPADDASRARPRGRRVPPAAAALTRRGRGGMIEGLAGLGAFLLLAFLRVPMAFAMGIVGFFGFAYKVNFAAASAMIAQTPYETGLAYALSVIPLFILMGNFVVRALMSEELYQAAYTFLGHRRGGLAMSTIVACAGFGAICGSSIATAATFSKV